MRKVSLIIAAVIFLMGLLLFIYPFIYKETEKERITETIENFEENTKVETDAEYESWEEYNRKLVTEQVFNAEDLFVFEKTDIVTDEVIATVYIPDIDVKLPVYNGGNEENMERGAIYLPHTSLPTGENDTNTVIGAHLRHKGVDMFRYLSELHIDDEVIVTTKWSTLTYKVIETKVIDPQELTDISIKKGHSLLTLFTCHPYPESTQRYLVICELYSRK